MRILICHSSLGSGGIESMVSNLANEMVKTQDVTVCTIFDPKETDICYNRLSKDIKFFSMGKVRGGISLSLLFKLYNSIRKGKYDAVHLNGLFYYYFIAIILLHNKVKFFYTVHNDAVQENCLWDRQLLPLKKYCFKHKWMYPITISQTSKDSFEQLYGTPNHLIYNGVPKINSPSADLSEFKINRGATVFFNPARISEQKNQLMLCRVVTRLINDGYNCSLIIAGSNDAPEIEKQLQEFYSENIKFVGVRNDAVSIMKASDAMCLSSLWEGMPVALIEALSVGCIPVCTPVGGIKDVISDGINGILSYDTEEYSFYLALKRFLDLSTEQKKQIKSNCLQLFEEFNIENTSKEYVEYFKTAE